MNVAVLQINCFSFFDVLKLFSAVLEAYEIFVRDSFGIVGNTVLLECHVPFTRFVHVDSWIVYDQANNPTECARNDYGIYSASTSIFCGNSQVGANEFL